MSEPSLREGEYRWKELIQMALYHRRELIAANVIAVLGAIAAVPVPLLIPLLVDEVLLDQPGRAIAVMNSLFPETWHGPVLYIIAILLLTLLLRFLALVFGVWQTWQFTKISKDVIYHIRRDLLLRLERISMSAYETMGSGAVASHMVTDLEAVDNFVSVTTSKFLVAVLSIIGTAIVLLWINWPLALFILFLNPLVIYFTTILGRKVKHLKKHENSAFQLFQESLEETLDAIQQIRASNRERHYIQRIIDKADHIRCHSTAFTWKSDAANRLSFMIFIFGFDIFRAVSMFMVLWSDLTIGEMLGVFAYLWFMMGPVQEVLNIQYAYNGAQAALGRINEMLKVDLEPRYPHKRDPFLGKPTVGLSLEGVHFAYVDGSPVLNGINLEVKAGEKVAFVGASGGGKTTLVQIILGLYPVKSGRVLFDRTPVEEIGMDVVRDHVSTVLQHPALLNDSVRINLTLGREIDDDRLWRSLEIAQLKETILAMNQGLDTQIGRFGVRLSGGQRQRLAIARMVLTDPKVVILDEATSALDVTTEGNLHTALQNFLKGRSTIIIAHRLSAVKQADRVLVFEDGQVIEEGRHEDLLQSNGLYSSLYGRQEQQRS
jgi:ATP-binding cassette subfamily C protein